MTTIPDHIIDKALAAGVRARAERAVALDRTESLDRALVAAALAAVADDLRAEGARVIRDALLSSLDIPTGPVQTGAMNATAGWASWITDRFNLPTPEETDR